MIRPRTPRREQLGEFLTTRRRSLDRLPLGLPPSGRRSDTGLSREEVAALAGVSGSWYTWLEQGRDINASRQVLSAVARVLQLTEAETEYAFALADPERPAPSARPDPLPDHLQHLLDAVPFPAFVVALDWAIVGWNTAYEVLYRPIGSLPADDRNLLWLIYTDATLRRMLPDWERDSRHFLAEFRAESGVRLSSDRHRAIVERLLEASEDFRVQWAEHAVERFESRRRTFVHDERGEIEFEHYRLVPSDAVDLHIVMYVPIAEPTP